MVHLCWSHSAVNRCCEQIAIWNPSGIHGNYYPACNCWKYCSVLWSWAFRERDIVSKGAIQKSYAVFVRAAVLPRGYMGIYWRHSHQKNIVSFFASWGGRVFSQLSRIRTGLIRRTGCPVVACMVQWRLVAGGYRPRHPGLDKRDDRSYKFVKRSPEVF